ncbi:MAG: tyrosine--tRNA ligase [Bacteroidales bacterium]
MKKNFIEELRWRGMLHDVMPGTEELLQKETVTAYLGIDPTADSLHIGHLVGIMMLKHLQMCGHKPLALIGGATGMIGDPSGKSQERNLLDEQSLLHNQACIQKQLSNFLDFTSDAPNKAEVVNNYDWIKTMTFLEFIRDIGKHITVNYMMSKDSVKKRFSAESGTDGMSFTEFTYQLAQAFDFLHLFQSKNCKMQMGGSDQWGNITTGTELIRRKLGAEAYAVTCSLITKADGGKFGKTESGNIWLDPERTSPYQFYQFWLNCSDEDSLRYIRIFTLFSKEEIEAMEEEQKKEPSSRILQKALAKDLTIRVHSLEDYQASVNASEILFGKSTTETLRTLSEKMFLAVFEGVPRREVSISEFKGETSLIDLLSEKTGIFSSKGEVRRAFKENSLSINKEKVEETTAVNEKMLLNGSYVLVQRGKKNYYIIQVK